jgi:predicted RNA-binding Zn ribbon-like protein
LLVRKGASSPSSTQPGGRDPAPGRLALVQAFVNTFFDLTPGRHGDDVLSSPAELTRWLAEHGLISPGAHPERSDLERAIALRDALRDLLETGANGEGATASQLHRLNQLAHGAAVEVSFDASGPRFASPDETSITGAIGVLVALVAAALIDGTWWRMKLCPGRDCGWAFYDHSRNQAGRWCSMSICGGREKARAHYRRRQATPARGTGQAGRDEGREAGRDEGREAGRDEGREAGRDEGREAGRDEGREAGHDKGWEAGRAGGRD